MLGQLVALSMGLEAKARGELRLNEQASPADALAGEQRLKVFPTLTLV